MTNKLYKVSAVLLAAFYSLLICSCFVIPASAASEYNGMVYRCTSTIYENVAGGVATLPNGITYTVNNGDTVYTGFNVSTEARGNYVLKYRTASSTATEAQVGDVIYLSADVRDITGGAKRIIDACFTPVPIWSSDDTSPYTSIYSTIAHYVFGDNFDTVPYGTYWVSMIAVIACVFIALLPFVVVYYLIRVVTTR